MHSKTLSICFAFLCFFAYGAVGAPVQLSEVRPLISYISLLFFNALSDFRQLTERDYTTVQHAVNGMAHRIASGTVGSVHALHDTYNGHHAVIKVISPGVGGHRAPLPAVEAHNSHHVGQLLGHGHDAATDTHYLVMKHMGVSAEHTRHDQATLDRLNNEANQRYAAEHGVRNR